MKEQKRIGIILWILIFLSQYWLHKIFRREKTETCSNPNLGNLTLFLLTLAVTLKVQWCDILVWNILILAFDCDRNLKTVIGVKLNYGISIWWYPPGCVCNHSCMLLKYSRIQEGLLPVATECYLAIPPMHLPHSITVKCSRQESRLVRGEGGWIKVL